MRAKTVEVAVTREDIKAGGRFGDCCPVAIATKRALRRKRLHVSHSGIYKARVQWGMLAATDLLAELPQAAQDWINDFDKGGGVEPFKFTVEVVAKP